MFKAGYKDVFFIFRSCIREILKEQLFKKVLKVFSKERERRKEKEIPLKWIVQKGNTIFT